MVYTSIGAPDQPGLQPIYIDYSIFSTLLTCEERSRVRYREGAVPMEEPLALGFGSAFHAGVEGWLRTADLQQSRASFLAEIKRRGTLLPISMDTDEKRSIERGLYLLEAYIEKYKDEPYEIMRRPDDNKPYVEMAFAGNVMDWRGRPVYYTGKIDNIKRSLIDG